MRLVGKVTLITGAAKGIGKSTAQLFLKNSAKVCLLDVTRDELHAVHETLSSTHGRQNVTSFIADVTEENSMAEAFRHTLKIFGRLNVVINNASILNESKMEEMLRINMGGVVRGTELALEYMGPEDDGVVLNISSMAGVYYTEGHRHLMPIYSASKAAVLAYTKCLAKSPDVLSKNVRLICACPRGTDTDLLNDPDQSRCRDVGAYQSGAREAGVMSPAEVAEIFMSLVKDDTNHGKAAAILGPEQYTFV